MKITIIILSLLFTFNTLTAQDNPAYRLFSANGKKVKFKKMVKKLKKSDIILFGEYHNNPISHWLQLEVTQNLSSDRKLILGAEMIEADNQIQLDQYLSNEIDADSLKNIARLWPNYKTDYKPLVDFAKDNKLKFIATNIPRRYASMVNHGDFDVLDTLTKLEKSWIAPLPIKFDKNLPTYQEILEMMGGHGGESIVKAQAMKDATMAHFILKNYSDNSLFIHYNGAFHSDKYEGILWYLKQQNSTLNYITITTVSQKNITKLDEENLNRADFIICVPENMTSTY